MRPDLSQPLDRIAFALCEFTDDDAPLRWQRFRGVAQLIANNPTVMADLQKLVGTAHGKLHYVRVSMDLVIPDDRFPTTADLIEFTNGSSCFDNFLAAYLRWAEENSACTTCASLEIKERPADEC